MDEASRLPGISNAWTMPIKARIDMLATGIRTPPAPKVFGPDLHELERLSGTEIERVVHGIPVSQVLSPNVSRAAIISRSPPIARQPRAMGSP